ncbi:MAG: DUF3084 domain-containing protein [Phormidesmis sp.]
MTGFVLLFAVACLGGVIATVGDRIGMKVGKSRLSLFNLRPRQTATLVSVVTGMVASFSTLMLLIALDSQLRKGLFELDEIQDDLSQAQIDLESTRSEKESVETTLAESTVLQEEAQSRLRETNRSLRTAAAREEEILASLDDTQAQLETVSEQADGLQDEIGALQNERQALLDEQAAVRSQIAQRDQEIAERNEALATRNAEIGERDEQIAQRDQEIAQREARLEELQTQQRFLDEQIARLEDDFENLRLGNVAIPRNANLALNLASPKTESEAVVEIEKTLIEANRIALRQVWPGLENIEQFALLFDPANFNQVVQTVSNGSPYAIIVSSEANYVVGEPCVGDIINREGEPCLLVNIDAVVNETIYSPGEVVASVQLESEDLSDVNLRERLNTLIVRAELQASRDGVINASPIVSRRLSCRVLAFLRRVQLYGEPVQIQAIARQSVSTLGPVSLELAAVKDGQMLFTTLTGISPAPEE